jgi:hypothetical protein
MSATQLSRLKSLLCVILGGIETNNPEVSIQAIQRMEAELSTCICSKPAVAVQDCFSSPTEKRDVS